MSRASKNDPESFVVSAYQNPYTGKLFAMEQKDAFLKELRASQRREKEEQQRERALLERQDFWTQLRSQVSAVEDIEAFCRARCSRKMEDWYLRLQHRVRLPSSDLWSLPIFTAQVKQWSISHEAPLGMSTNWCLRDETRAGHKIALHIESARNLNATMYDNTRSESGFRVLNQDMFLFADDWPFVQRMALGEFLEGKLKPVMTRHPVNEFGADMERYSVLQTGMPLSQLKDLYALGACTKESLMAFRPSAPPTLGLPAHIEPASFKLD